MLAKQRAGLNPLQGNSGSLNLVQIRTLPNLTGASA